MKPFTRSSRLLSLASAALAAAFILAGCGITLADDVTPPPNYRPATQAPASANNPGQQVNVSLPGDPADLASGEAIYAEKCLPCHGEAGLGDGPDAANLPNPVAKLGDPAVSREASPAEWYQVVTVGNLQRYMPGFASLNDQQRWDVVGYAFSLSAKAEELEQGRTLFAANCAECHGESGRGDGPRAAELTKAPGDWTQPARLADLSMTEISQLIVRGKGAMPAFGGSLDENQRLALAAYARSLSFSSSGTPGGIASEGSEASGAAGEEPAAGTPTPGPTEAPSGEEGEEAVAETVQTLTVTGKIQSAGPDGQLPADMTVSLVGFSGMAPAFTLEGKAGADGAFQFDDVEFNENYVYVASAQANGIDFNSEIVHGSDITSDRIDLPIEIYSTTTSVAGLKADRLHVFFDFSAPGSIQVIELFIISNPTEQVVVAPSQDGAVLNFELPADATNLQFEDSRLGERYIETDNGFGDRANVAPGTGQHQVLFAYELPYDRKLELNLHSPVPVDAAVIMLPQDGVKLKSDQLVDAGERNVQGLTYRMYNAASSVQPGQPVKIQLSGRASASANGETDPLLVFGLGAAVFALVLGGGAYWFIRQRQELQPAYETGGDFGPEGTEENESSDSILEAIITLDDQYQAGSLPETAYHERRAVLKERLAEVLKREESA